ncbi:hypothetical protein T03_4025, partial [Trichinella britovi]
LQEAKPSSRCLRSTPPGPDPIPVRLASHRYVGGMGCSDPRSSSPSEKSRTPESALVPWFPYLQPVGNYLGSHPPQLSTARSFFRRYLAISVDISSDHLRESASAKAFTDRLLLAASISSTSFPSRRWLMVHRCFTDFWEDAAKVAGCALFSCRRNPGKELKAREQTEQTCVPCALVLAGRLLDPRGELVLGTLDPGLDWDPSGLSDAVCDVPGRRRGSGMFSHAFLDLKRMFVRAVGISLISETAQLFETTAALSSGASDNGWQMPSLFKGAVSQGDVEEVGAYTSFR